MGVFQRMRTIGRVKANQALDRLEDPATLAAAATLEVQDAYRTVSGRYHESKTAEILAGQEITQARAEARLYRSRAEAQLRMGDEAGAVASAQQALFKDYEAEMLEGHLAQLQQVNTDLHAAVGELKIQLDMVSMLGRIEKSRFYAAAASKAAVESRYGRPGQVGTSPYEQLEQARRRTNEVMAGALASKEIGQLLPDQMAAAPDFSFQARHAIEVAKSGGSLADALAAPPLAAIDGGGPGEVDPAAVADTTAAGPA